jgi:hypothetical protein
MFMAKSYHLKEIIELETGCLHLKSLQNFMWNQLKSRQAKFPFVRHPLDEMATWNAALQLDKPAFNHDASGQ